MFKLTAIILLALIVTPVFAEEDCQVVEFQDHFEVTCTGDAKSVHIAKQSLAPATEPVQDASSQPQAPEQQQTTRQAETPTASQPADAARAPVLGGFYAKAPGRQGRPSQADMNAAIEARRKLIQEQSPKVQPAVQ